MYKLTVLLKYRDMCRCTVIMKGGGRPSSCIRIFEILFISIYVYVYTVCVEI